MNGMPKIYMYWKVIWIPYVEGIQRFYEKDELALAQESLSCGVASG